jgi:hypothetical protein
MSLKQKVKDLESDVERLNNTITNTLGHDHKTCIDKFDERVKEEINKMILDIEVCSKKVQPMPQPSEYDTIVLLQSDWNKIKKNYSE